MQHFSLLVLLKPDKLRSDFMAVLEQLDCHLMLTADFQVAIQLVKQNCIDGVVIESALYDDDGLEWVLAIRDYNQHLPILCISPDDPLIKNRFIQAGASQVIGKHTNHYSIIKQMKKFNIDGGLNDGIKIQSA